MSEENVETFNRAIEAYNRRDVEGLLEVGCLLGALAAGLVLRLVLIGQTYFEATDVHTAKLPGMKGRGEDHDHGIQGWRLSHSVGRGLT